MHENPLVEMLKLIKQLAEAQHAGENAAVAKRCDEILAEIAADEAPAEAAETK
jgi:hypothetical protein